MNKQRIVIALVLVASIATWAVATNTNLWERATTGGYHGGDANEKINSTW